MKTKAFVVLVGAFLGLSSTVSADAPAGGPESAAELALDPSVAVAQWQQPYTTSGPPPQSSYAYTPSSQMASAGPVEGARHHGPRHRTDLGLSLPIPASDPKNAADMGVGLFGMFAIDLGWFLPTFDLGWQWNPLNAPPGTTGGSSRSLSRIHFGIGAQFEIENDSIVTPVFGAIMDFNFWHVSGDVGTACGGYYYWYCYSYNNYDFTLGFTGKVGVDIQVMRRQEMFTLGLGVLPSVTLQGGPFQKAEAWVTPYITATFHR